ncbi:MAG: fatty acid desaturase [Planctomycetes bacterium]|nr:fatty acid desaturase [Planctomycetota bacterium]
MTNDADAPSSPSASAPTAPSARGGPGAAWRDLVATHQRPHRGRAIRQLFDTVGSYVAAWFLMYLALPVSWWLALPLAALAGGLLVRVFIIFHDCGHGSFFRSNRANAIWGAITGLLTFTPYLHWRGEHAIHHGTAGDLDRRGIGDIWTMTVREYLEASRWRRFSYRLSRNPIVLFVVAPLVMFLWLHRITRVGCPTRERWSVYLTNLTLAGAVFGMCCLFGTVEFLVLQLVVLMVGGAAGVWLFYLQHQFEDAYWERGADWNYERAALQGSSFLRLPRVLQWFSGNIGFHHIHHLSPRIPNYNLERCHASDPLFHGVRPLTIRQGLRALGLKLWCESRKKLVGFRALRQRQLG